jgi:hypothetical protein
MNPVHAPPLINLFINILGEILGVARDSIRNEGTREINCGVI